ncbi:cytochrome P450 2K3-like [Sphaerodactylus townsendi]|uniref:cytochrome P450 2K3-like n=1 Tax=Sphaerodactylus townsendi TaxID=933632 RepID=UPI002025CB01|nr:cytochrome P450 2K3-like [Sphaerodactylus townsendi]
MVVLAGYETVKEALVNQADAFADRPSIPIIEDAQQGHGIVFSNGEVWKVMRRFAISTLRDYGMGKKTIEDRIVEECRFLLQEFESFDEICAAFIQSHTFLRRLKELDENDQRSFIDAFLIRQQEEKTKNQSNEFFHNENLKVVVSELFGAGTETTSTTLRWGLLLMMKYPEIQRKVQEEMTKVIGSAQPRIEHRAKLPYTDAVVHEIQRFANIAPASVPHATNVDVTLGGYFIPKVIVLSCTVIAQLNLLLFCYQHGGISEPVNDVLLCPTDFSYWEGEKSQ